MTPTTTQTKAERDEARKHRAALLLEGRAREVRDKHAPLIAQLRDAEASADRVWKQYLERCDQVSQIIATIANVPGMSGRLLAAAINRSPTTISDHLRKVEVIANGGVPPARRRGGLHGGKRVRTGVPKLPANLQADLDALDGVVRVGGNTGA